MEIWDGYYADGSLAGVDLIRDEPIPEGLYHLACEALVRHTDGDYLLMLRDQSKKMYPGCYEATAGGSALKGEDALTCVRRELLEETGVGRGEFTLLERHVFEEDRCIFSSFLCVTDWDKNAVTTQPGETAGYRWVSEEEFVEYLHSDRAIDRQIRRNQAYFRKMGYIV